MSAQNTDTSMAGGDTTLDKGKGKAAEPTREDVSMGEEDSSDEESGAEEQAPEPEEVDEDNMEEIDPDNIIQDGRRTRGKTIDFTKANEDAGLEDYDEDDDEDFEDPDDSMQQ
ncbi:Histone chaperone domain CHZ [Macrophomina phaseolina MS6]|uniref:Histone chaperone domain CHZ n=2 Tax=Macrophomina phaseolina TaxID=35725 RepID=K2RM28_MACPH|nr:Histone chaperone domain CHZ [Macrophomina phaseolina MS6]KAH7046651.1 histone chaperone domain CHZ-domain-containing protein [Macrophomina phaseolina]